MRRLHVRMEIGDQGCTIAEHTLEVGDRSVTVGKHAHDFRFQFDLGQGIPPELELLTRDDGGWNVLRLPEPTGYQVWISEGTWQPVEGGAGEWAHLTKGGSGLAEFRFRDDSKNVDRIVRIYFRVL